MEISFIRPASASICKLSKSSLGSTKLKLRTADVNMEIKDQVLGYAGTETCSAVATGQIWINMVRSQLSMSHAMCAYISCCSKLRAQSCTLNAAGVTIA